MSTGPHAGRGIYSSISNSSLPHKLGVVRRQAGYSISDLADRSGLTSRTIRDIESGKRDRVLEKTLFLLAEALDCSLESLFENDGENHTEIATHPPSQPQAFFRSRKFLWLIVTALVVVSCSVLWSLEYSKASFTSDKNNVVMRGGLTGRTLWRHHETSPINQVQQSPWSRKELLVALSYHSPDGGVLLDLDIRTGKELWRTMVDTCRVNRAFGSSLEDEIAFHCTGFKSIDFDGDGIEEVAAKFTHIQLFPCCICLIDRHGNLKRQYTNWGHLSDFLPLDIDGDGKQELVASGTNNAPVYQAATVLLLGEHNWGGASFDPLSRPNTSVADSSLARVIIPHFGSGFIPMIGLRLHAHELRAVSTMNGSVDFQVSVGRGPYTCSIVLDTGLHPLRAIPNDTFYEQKETIPQTVLATGSPFEESWRTQWMKSFLVFRKGKMVIPSTPPDLPLKIQR